MEFFNNKKRLLSSFVLLFISIMSLAQQMTPSEYFHDTKGNVDVDGAGQLQFSLPIALPPGIKDVAPNVSLVYSSGSTNGLAGYGWNISGIISISRSGRNIEKDGELKGIQLDYSNTYNFNDQRLILKSGEYGKDGAEYVTEKFSNLKIRSIGSITGQAWSGPEYWEVTSPDGSQTWYGATSSGNSSARTPIDYNIVKWKDAQGNYITYNYLQDTDTNVSFISSIKWGGNETLGKEHFNEILFNYNGDTSRTLTEQSYVKGVSFIQNKLLNTIVVKANSSQYRKYKVTYRTDATRYHFVDKIQEFNADNQPATPIEFISKENKYYYTSTDHFGGGEFVNFQNLVMSGDFLGYNRLNYIIKQNVDGSRPAGYYIQEGLGFPRYFLGSENVFENATTINIKDANGIVRSNQGIVSYSLNSTTKDITLKYYAIDLTKLITSSNVPNALTLIGTKVIPKNLWDETEHTSTTNPLTFYDKTSSLGKLVQYDMDGDGVPEILIEKTIRITNTTCPNGGGGLDPLDPSARPNNCQAHSYDQTKYIVAKQQDNSFSYFEFYFDKSKDILFADFNGDGIDDIASSAITYNTTLEGESVPEYTLHAYNIKKDELGSLGLVEVYSADYSGRSSTVQIGDFNGDGLADLFTRTNDNGHYVINMNTGITFLKLPYFNAFNTTEEYVTSQDGHYSTARVLDINADGKSDIINYTTNYLIVNPQTASTYMSLSVSENHGYLNGRIQFESNGFFTRQTNSPTFLREILGVKQNQFSIYYTSGGTNGNGGIFQFDHYSNLSDKPIEEIKQGGITTLVSYNSQNDFYKTFRTVQYPLMELQNVSSKIVTSINQSGGSYYRGKNYRYRGLVINLHNKKTVGFQQKANSSWYSQGFENTKIWSGVEIDPSTEGVPVKEWSVRTNTDESKIFPTNLSEDNTQLLSFKSTIYQTDKILNGQVVTTIPQADKANQVTAILPKISRAKDFLTGAIAESTSTYGQYYLPSQTISKINNSYAVTTSNYLYDNNPSGLGSNYYIGRPTSKTELVQAYGDSKSSKEEYTYQNNQIETLKTWNRDNTAYMLDTFTYDGFGNVLQKVSANSINSQTITSGYLYDPKGRFLVKQTDNSGLQTETIYNNWGQVENQTDPHGNILTNTYDSWGKLLTSTTNLGGTTSYQYDKDSDYLVTITQNSPNGNVSKKITDVWGQVFKTSTKAFGQGKFICQQTKYDGIGRKIKESEPYFEEQGATKWNTIAYDDSVYPAKVTATAFSGKQTETTVSGLITTMKEINGYQITKSNTADALGNIVSTTDKGGTIQFSYNAAGEQTRAKYEDNIVVTKYDSWGRKFEFNDPSNGVYKYEYDAFGRAKKTISPKGTKEYIYNNIGQLISQNELSTVDGGQTTNKAISFTYNNKKLLTAKSGTVNGQAFSSAYIYDTYGRLLSSTENSNGKVYSEKGILYDSKGRVTSYEKELNSSGATTKVSIENIYSPWNGELYQIKDKISSKILWELQEANAKGMLLKEKLGAVNINNNYDSNDFLKTVNHSSAAKPDILKLTYTFDAIKNELTNRKTEGDFFIDEKFYYDDNNRLINWTDPVTGLAPSSNRNVYDAKGRIIQNDQVGTIKFENAAKIYQPTGMTLSSAGEQNYNNDLIQTIVYNENNDPVQINGEKARIKFGYGLGNMRQRVDIIKPKYFGPVGPGGPGSESRTPLDPNVPVWQTTLAKFYNEDNSFEVVTDQATGQEKHILYIAGTPYESSIIYVKDFGQANGSYKFLHKDYIGSVLAISDEAGNKVEGRHYDAWGNFTHLKIGNGAVTTNKTLIAGALLLIDRGYTSHEHFMDVGIIHMNGRLYDPLLRRFLNADDNIQDPANTQNYNKYGYVMNNPLMYNDPSGEFWGILIGAVVGSYFSGVQANNGNLNPIKWDWKSTTTWTSVVGGAFAGGAIGGAIQNINTNGTKFFQNSVVGAAGGIFNGIANGQNVFKSALIGFSGVNYTFNLPGNSITSTDGINTAYKFFVSPADGYSGGGWDDLTKSILLNYVKTNFCVTCSTGALQQKAGKMFENAFNSIMESDLASSNYTSNRTKFPGIYNGKSRNTVPDGVYDLVRDQIEYRKDNVKVGPYNIRIPIPTGINTMRFSGVQYAEVKAMDGTLYTSSNQGQLEAMITSMHTNNGVYRFGGQFLIGTTSDTVISPNIYTLGASFGKSAISIVHMTSQYRMISGAMQVRFSQGWGRVTSTSYIK